MELQQQTSNTQVTVILILQIIGLLLTGVQQILASIHKFKLEVMQLEMNKLAEVNSKQSQQLQKIKNTQKLTNQQQVANQPNSGARITQVSHEIPQSSNSNDNDYRQVP